MDENKIPAEGNENEEVQIYTLTDEDGNEIDFELLAYATINNNVYYALTPVKKDGKQSDGDIFEEYVILKEVEDEDGDISLESIEDDDEFDEVADYFDNRFDEEFNYDE